MGVWERRPQPTEANWGLAAQHPSLGDFHNFSIIMKHFEAYLDLNFCFETFFDNG